MDKGMIIALIIIGSIIIGILGFMGYNMSLKWDEVNIITTQLENDGYKVYPNAKHESTTTVHLSKQDWFNELKTRGITEIFTNNYSLWFVDNAVVFVVSL